MFIVQASKLASKTKQVSSALNEQYIKPTKEKVAERGGMGAILRNAASGVKTGGSSLVSNIMTKSSTYAGNLSGYGYNSMPDGGASPGGGEHNEVREARDDSEYSGAGGGAGTGSTAGDAASGGGGTLLNLKKSMSSFLGSIASAASGRSGYADPDADADATTTSYNDFTSPPPPRYVITYYRYLFKRTCANCTFVAAKRLLVN